MALLGQLSSGDHDRMLPLILLLSDDLWASSMLDLHRLKALLDFSLVSSLNLHFMTGHAHPIFCLFALFDERFQLLTQFWELGIRIMKDVEALMVYRCDGG